MPEEESETGVEHRDQHMLSLVEQSTLYLIPRSTGSYERLNAMAVSWLLRGVGALVHGMEAESPGRAMTMVPATGNGGLSQGNSSGNENEVFRRQNR